MSLDRYCSATIIGVTELRIEQIVTLVSSRTTGKTGKASLNSPTAVHSVVSPAHRQLVLANRRMATQPANAIGMVEKDTILAHGKASGKNWLRPMEGATHWSGYSVAG